MIKNDSSEQAKKRLLNVNQLSELLSVKSGTISWWISSGFIPHYKIGRLVRFKESEIMEWLEKKKHKGRLKQVPDVEIEVNRSKKS